MRQDFRASIGKLPAFVKGQEACRHLPQVELPGFVPLSCLSEFQRRWAGFELCDLEQEVDGAVRGLGEDAWVEFDFAEIIPDLLDFAHAIGPVDGVQAADARLGLNCTAPLVWTRRDCHHSHYMTAPSSYSLLPFDPSRAKARCSNITMPITNRLVRQPPLRKGRVSASPKAS